MARLPKGRKRISIQKIETQSNLEVTFSKRRNGVFVKASELSLLCHCQVAIIIFSREAEDNIFAFGEPSIEQILDTFMKENPDQKNGVVDPLMENHDVPAELCEPREEDMAEYKATIQDEKIREKIIIELPNNPHQENCLKKWWLTPVEDLTLDEAKKMLEELEEFKLSIDSYGPNTGTSSSKQTTEVSVVVPHDGGFTHTPDHDSFLASTSKGLECSNKGKSPIQD
ncbi:Agamous-like MADS-box protein AGL62 [Heracleum sosnowskyi]|uniref:Agamous-like MADS-box protein AGL62 n=1 Tax=Heracleum sosnowskyi TaxID=360622 RepID=A0AAD8MVA8_9APIA|nr:Agamous-like MADS-box protein AGL62 [Heracleum sosnowskyi]